MTCTSSKRSSPHVEGPGGDLGAEKEERAREGVRGKQDETEGGGGVKKKQIRGKDQHKEYKKAKIEGDEGGEEK